MPGLTRPSTIAGRPLNLVSWMAGSSPAMATTVEYGPLALFFLDMLRRRVMPRHQADDLS